MKKKWEEQTASSSQNLHFLFRFSRVVTVKMPSNCRGTVEILYFPLISLIVQILILDDESLDLFVAKKLLSLEFATEGFTTEEETMEWAKANDFDVVLIDYYLTPDLIATEVLSKLRSLKEKRFKAFVLSNFVEPDEVQRLKQSGFDDVIFKPLTLENFKALIAR